MSWEPTERAPANPLGWSVPVARFAGTRLRLHFAFLAYALVVILRGAFGPAESSGVLGAGTVAMIVAALLVQVALRECARALVVRASGGLADEVVLWPLGSLQGIDPAPGWRAALLSATVGMSVSAVALASLGIALGLVTGEWWGAALPDPFAATWLTNPHPWWVDALWILQWTGVQLALLNLLPMLPLDGGRVAEAIILRRRGEFETPRLAATVTLGVAGACGIAAMVRDLPTLLTVAIACAGYAAQVLWRLRAGDAVGAAGESWKSGRSDLAEDAGARAEAARRDAERRAAADEERALDAVLGKIAREGADRLTDEERAVLARATERRKSRGRG